MCILKVTNGKATKIDTDLELKTLQSLVGGDIEVVYPFDAPVALICNEEGKVNGLSPNFALSYQNKVYDVVVGECLICGLSEESFDSLVEELATKFVNLFNNARTGIVVAGKYVPVIHIDYV